MLKGLERKGTNNEKVAGYCTTESEVPVTPTTYFSLHCV